MGRGAHSKTMRKVNREFARGKVTVGRGHASSDRSTTLTQKGYRNTRKNNLEHRKDVTNKMMIFGTPTSYGVERMTKTLGKTNDVELTNDLTIRLKKK